MTRTAILIGVPQAPSTVYLKGVKQDLINYKEFLQTPLGGNWESTEIKIFYPKPTKKQIIDYLNVVDADFTFLVFSGHGFIDVNEVTNVCLMDDDITEYELETISPRQTIILDSCRTPLEVIEEQIFMEKLAKALAIRGKSTRKIFDDAVFSCEKGTITVYSVGVNEEAGEHPSHGGYFTQSMLEAATNWEDVGLKSVLNVNEAFLRAKKILVKYTKKQHPQINTGRRLHMFPFAVKRQPVKSLIELGFR